MLSYIIIFIISIIIINLAVKAVLSFLKTVIRAILVIALSTVSTGGISFSDIIHKNKIDSKLIESSKKYLNQEKINKFLRGVLP